MDIPESMRAELLAWNDGQGVDLQTWVGCEGGFALAVGYAALFWPEFIEVGRYVLRTGRPAEAIRSFESQPGATRQSVEWVLNHVHLTDMHFGPRDDASADKLRALGAVLADMHRAKLAWQFPERQFHVEFHVPEDREDLSEYWISFWQSGH